MNLPCLLCEQAAIAFEKAETDRLFHTEKALKQYCSIEKQALEARIRMLASFEEGAIAQLNSKADVELFASKSRDVDNTRMCSNALKMMEWDFKSRCDWLVPVTFCYAPPHSHAALTLRHYSTLFDIIG